MKKTLIACSLFLSTIASAQSVYNITSFGAVPNAKQKSTAAIQKAIDKCAAAGGGQVLIPAGTFTAGSIFMKSGVTLFLDAAAVLKGSPDSVDYFSPGNGIKTRAFICALSQQNIGIAGTGTIDGNGGHENFYSSEPKNGKENRPNTIGFYKSTYVKLKEFTLKDGARWDVTVHDCDFVSVDDIKVLSRIVANNDGLDIADCQNVTVSNSYFDCGDDGICLKSEKNRGVKRVTITNCIIKSESNAIKFGTSSIAGFEDITISNCTLFDTRLSGIALQVVDGGTLNRVLINNIVMHNVNGSIFLKIGNRKGDKPGILKNVMISNITADGIGNWVADTTARYYKEAHDSRIGVVIAGQKGYDIENLVLSNINLQFKGGGTPADAKPNMRDNAATYPEYINFGLPPAYGINCRDINGLQLNNISLSYTTPDTRPAIYLENVQNATLSAITAQVAATAPSYIATRNVSNIFITTCKPNSANIPFLKTTETATNITATANDFQTLTTICHPSSVIRNLSVSNLIK